MPRRLVIISAGVLGVAVLIAFLALSGRKAPMPVAMDEEGLADIQSKPVVKSGPEPVPGRAAFVEVADREAPTDLRWTECADAIPDELPPALDGLGEGRTPPIVATLSTSGSAEHVLAGALLRPNNDPDAIRADIERALALDGDHPLVLWHAVHLCDTGRGGDYCRSDAFRSGTYEQLGSNAAYWSRRAVAEILRSNEQAALTALQRAAVAPEFDGYADEHTALFERALAASGDLSYGQRAIAAYSITAFVPGPAYETVRICKERATGDVLWRDACIGWARRLATDGNTVFDQVLGNELLAAMYEIAERNDLADEAAARREAIRDLVNEGPAWEVPVMFDDRFADRFFDVFTTKGEIEALLFAQAEISRLKMDPYYDPCALIIR